MKRSIGRWVALLVALMMATPSAALADWVDNFEGGLEQTWSFDNLKADMSGSSSSFTAGEVNDELVLTDPTIPGAGGAGIGFGVVPEEFRDALVWGIVNPSESPDTNAIIGILGRIDAVNMTGYALTLTYDKGRYPADMDISRIDQGADYESLVSEDFLPDGELPGSDSYYLELEMRGPNLEGRVYDSPGGTLLQSVSATDPNFFDRGMSGVLVLADETTASGSNPLYGAFDFVGSMAVPEPSAMLLLVLGASMLSLRRRRR
jgi:opacity protein-like surface antigen